VSLLTSLFGASSENSAVKEVAPSSVLPVTTSLDNEDE